MKRVNHLFDQIGTRENLRLALSKSLRGKRHRADARSFCADTENRFQTMGREIANGTIQVGRIRQFVIHDPKQRTITAPCFEERVLHHAIMNVCEPVLDRSLVYHTYACRQGKGREACIIQAVRNSRKYRWYLKVDVARYFDNVSHDVLLQMLERRFRERRLLSLLTKIIRVFGTEERRGLPIGSLMSQHFANFYLSMVDRLIMEHTAAKAYVRYMDDMVVWGNSLKSMRQILYRLETVLFHRLNLKVKDSPTMNLCQSGISMLGCRVFPGYALLSRRSKCRFRSKLAQLERSLEREKIGELEFQARATALTAFVTGAGIKSWQFRSAVLNHHGR